MRNLRFGRAAHRVFVLAMVVVLLVPSLAQAGNSNGRDRKVEWRFAGWRLANIGIFDDDLAPDAAIRPAAFQHLLAKGRPGPAEIRGFVRPPVAMGPPEPPTSPECAGFDIESPVTEAAFAAVLEKDLAQLYFVLESGFVCVSFAGRVEAHLAGNFVGGTRKFEGATGTWELTANVVTVSPVPIPGGFGLEQFQAQTGTITGTVHIPGDDE